MNQRFPFIVRVDMLKLMEVVLGSRKNKPVDFVMIPSIEYVFGKLPSGVCGRFYIFEEGNKKWSKIVIDILNVIKCCSRSIDDPELFRVMIRSELKEVIAHEMDHWCRWNENDQKIFSFGENTRLLMRWLVISFVVITNAYLISVGLSGIIPWELVILTCAFLFTNSHFFLLRSVTDAKRVIDSVCDRTFFRLCRLLPVELSARKFGRKARKDSRWDEVVFVDWQEQPP
jgi:hypothetical protein